MAEKLAPRAFPHTQKGKPRTKRVDWPAPLRPGHVMVTGGREGESIAARTPGSPEHPTHTGWDGKPAASWTETLAAGRTYPNARTQPSFLRRVRPEQRAWARGIMPVSDIERVLYGGVVPPTRVDVEVAKVGGQYPRAEITWWLEEEGVFGSVTGRVSYLRVVVTEDDAVVRALGIDEKQGKADNIPRVVDRPEYAEALGFVFTPDADAVTLPGVYARDVAIPYFMVGRARRIHEDAKKPWRVSGRPTPDANTGEDPTFNQRMGILVRRQQDALLDAAVQRLTEPRRAYTQDITPDVQLRALSAGDQLVGLGYTRADGKTQVADPLSSMNVARATGASLRAVHGKPTSGLDAAYDPLTPVKRKKAKKRPKRPYRSLLDE